MHSLRSLIPPNKSRVIPNLEGFRHHKMATLRLETRIVNHIDDNLTNCWNLTCHVLPRHFGLLINSSTKRKRWTVSPCKGRGAFPTYHPTYWRPHIVTICCKWSVREKYYPILFYIRYLPPRFLITNQHTMSKGHKL